MKPIFNSVKVNRPKRNLIDLTHEKKLTTDFGKLVPVYTQQVIPGDSFKVNIEFLVRLMPMLAPVMHRANIFVHHFFVPYRLVWDNWNEFITGGVDGLSAPVHPTVSLSSVNWQDFKEGELADYMGLPTVDGEPTTGYTVSSLWFRAYQLIYNEFYRDQTISTEISVPKTDGDDSAESQLFKMRYRTWEKDYFTSALPWTQRGGDVHLPLGIEADDINYADQSTIRQASGANPTADQALNAGLTGHTVLTGSTNGAMRVENIESIEAGSITVNALRQAIALQQWLEKNARGGSRYIEQILMHFGVKSSDARLQRPEYLGGGKSPIVISEVLNTTGTATAAQGAMAGHGIAVNGWNGFKKFFEEHGVIISIMSVTPRSQYHQGIPKDFLKLDKLDHYWPSFAHLGEQEILNEELYFNPDDLALDNEKVFGYTPRYAEYKYQRSSIHGAFRSSLRFWTMARTFANLPGLSPGFLHITPEDAADIFAVEEGDKILVQALNDVKALRPMPVFGTPMI